MSQDWRKRSPQQPAPSARGIRRSCNRELYRAMKKLKIWITPDQLEAAEKYYYRKVITNLPFITENGSNRKALCDWWDAEVAPEVAKLWSVEADKLCAAFRESFGG